MMSLHKVEYLKSRADGPSRFLIKLGEKTLKQQINLSAKYMLEYEQKSWAVHESFVGRYILLRVLFKVNTLNSLLSFSFLSFFLI